MYCFVFVKSAFLDFFVIEIYVFCTRSYILQKKKKKKEKTKKIKFFYYDFGYTLSEIIHFYLFIFMFT